MKKFDDVILYSLKLALAKMSGYTLRIYAAELANSLFEGSARKTERALGVSRHTVVTGQKELSSGIRCVENFHLRGRKKKRIPS